VIVHFFIRSVVPFWFVFRFFDQIRDVMRERFSERGEVRVEVMDD